ncbi:MAG: hypothetical protein L0177_19880 [Chloroflexi bacterium]|nr:hypothetical protein [Chloroflexota bacterium]
MRDECRVCLTDNTLEEKFRLRETAAAFGYVVLECRECKAIAIYSPYSKRLTWYRRDGEVSGVEEDMIERLLDPSYPIDDNEEIMGRHDYLPEEVSPLFGL